MTFIRCAGDNDYKKGVVLQRAIVLRLDDVILLTGQGFTKDATLRALSSSLRLSLHNHIQYIIHACNAVLSTETFPQCQRRSTGKLSIAKTTSEYITWNT